MSGGGQPASTTVDNTTTAKTPYGPAMPYLLQSMQDAAKIYSQGPQQYTPWSQIAGFTPEQQAAQQGILNYAGSQGTQQFIGQTQGAVQGQMAGGPNYLQPGMQQAGNVLTGYAGNNNLQDNAGVLNQMAYGEQGNPYLDTQVQSAMQQLSNKFMADTLPSLRRAAIGQGSYGSSRNALAEGTAASGLDAQMQATANQMYMTDYQNQEQNRLAALGQIAQQQNQQATAAGNMYQTGATQGLTNVGYGLQNFKNAAAMPLDMLNQIYQVGTDQYNQAQNQLSDATNRWNFNQNAGWDQLSRFKQLIDPTSGLGGSGTSNATTAQYAAPTSTAGNVMGGLLQALPLAMAAYGGMSGSGAGGAGTPGAIGGGTSTALSPSSMGISNASMASAPSMGNSNFGAGIGNNTSWAMPSSFGFGG